MTRLVTVFEVFNSEADAVLAMLPPYPLYFGLSLKKRESGHL